MKSLRSILTLQVFSIVLLLAIGTGAVYAQANGGFDLSWSTIDGGGGSHAGDSYRLGGTLGQPDAGTHGGGAYTLQGGFWGGVDGPPVPAVLVGHVTWQGRPAQAHMLQQLPITVTLKSASVEVEYPVQTTNASGYFTVEVAGLAPGTWNWRVKGPKYLSNLGAVNLTGATQTNSEMGLMLVGDCNNDNYISIVDFNILKNTFGRENGEPGYDDRAEFTGDLIVSISDFNLMKQNFGVVGAPPIRPGESR